MGAGAALFAFGCIFNVGLVAPRLNPDFPDTFSLKAGIVTFQAVFLLTGVMVFLAGCKKEFFFSRRGVLLSCFSLMILLGTLEIGLRCLGYAPYRPINLPVKVEPGGKLYEKHPSLGYRLRHGSFIITLPDGYSFKATHLENTLRATHPPRDSVLVQNREQIWIFGCSYTHGWSLDDEQTYPWLLQQKLPKNEVVNFGVGGYGTLQSLVQFKEALGNGSKPLLAVLAYGSIHDMRNTLARRYLKSSAPWNKLGEVNLPCARLDTNGNLIYSKGLMEFHEVPFMRELSLVHFMESAFDQIELDMWRPHRISRALIEEFAATAASNHVDFMVAGIVGDEVTAAMLDFCRQKGIKCADISVDMNVAENVNLPHDFHPSPLANQRFAAKLTSYLQASVLRRPPD